MLHDVLLSDYALLELSPELPFLSLSPALSLSLSFLSSLQVRTGRCVCGSEEKIWFSWRRRSEFSTVA
jgi:hypothetical protein